MKANFLNILKKPVSYEISENYPDALIIINYQKNIIYWNKQSQHLFGHLKKEVLGKGIGFIFENQVDKIYQSLGENRPLAICLKNKAGEDIYVEIACADSDSKEEVIIAVRDVTRTRKLIDGLKEELEKVSSVCQNKSSFIAELSHELKTPVHSIIGFSQAMIDGINGPVNEKQEKYLSIINKNASNLMALINNIVDISKLEAGRMEFNFKHFDIIQLVNSITEAISTQATEKKLDFTVDLTDVVKRNIYSEENMLRQVLINILSNAVKFTEIGSVKLKAIHPDLEFLEYQGIAVPPGFTDKSYLMFQVSDTGIVISDEDLGHIFDEYRNFDRSASKKYGGTGLGMAISRKILVNLGGIIRAESELTQGSTFSFIIPIERPKVLE